MSPTFRAAFYGRVSTEDRQSPTDSLAWQRAAATALVQAHGGRIVSEYLDVGVSRSMPWSRRPEAAHLLGDCAHPDRGFEAVVIGEPQRAFSGNQYGLTAPLLWHYGVELWVPEVGGRVDPESEAHDLVMSLFGGLSKAERARIQRRVKTAMTTMARTGGRYLGGRPPYGYRLVAASPHPNAEKARGGATLNRLELDPATAPVVKRIFADRLAGRGYSSIARALNQAGVPSPSGADPARNPHRGPRGWAASAVRAILANPRYTGHEVWGRQRRDYELIDPTAPAEGHQRRMRWNDADDWIWSPRPTHEPIISRADWDRARALTTTNQRAARSHDQTYLLRGRVICAVCGRRMTGTTRGQTRRYYRCELRRARPGLKTEHPVDAYVREDALTEALDAWLADLFAPERAQETARLVLDAAEDDHADRQAISAARRRLHDARQRLAQYRRALDGGADPATLTTWITEAADQERAAAAELDLARATAPPPLKLDDVLTIVNKLGGLAGVLSLASPADRARLYEALNVTASYDAAARTAQLTLEVPRGAKGVSEGGLEPPRPCGH
jgi:site-specific DNA recombinase